MCPSQERQLISLRVMTRKGKTTLNTYSIFSCICLLIRAFLLLTSKNQSCINFSSNRLYFAVILKGYKSKLKVKMLKIKVFFMVLNDKQGQFWGAALTFSHDFPELGFQVPCLFVNLRLLPLQSLHFIVNVLVCVL